MKGEKEKMNQCPGLFCKAGSKVVHTGKWYYCDISYLPLMPSLNPPLLHPTLYSQPWHKELVGQEQTAVSPSS